MAPRSFFAHPPYSFRKKREKMDRGFLLIEKKKIVCAKLKKDDAKNVCNPPDGKSARI